MTNETYEWWIAQEQGNGDDANVVVDASLAPLDNEAYRRDFPELEYNRWEDDGGSYRDVDVTKVDDAEPTSIRIYEPGRKTLGELIDEQIDLAQPVSEDALVRVTEGNMYRYAVIIIERNDDE